MPDLSGKTLGKVRLIERLGRGGMAEVYRAYQPNLDRDVAVKIMHSYLAEDDEFLARFRREAKGVAALRHPHIVQMYDFDVEDDVHYMVMEYVRGETLKTRLERLHAEGKRMGLDEIVGVFDALCDALDYAHAEGRVHRDLKPANIMFDDRRLVLTDFGIAAIIGGTRLTASGAMIGTPAYMSPEQSQGAPGDARSDVYSLGVILYEMATGRLPYDADTPLAIVLKHLNEPLPPPSQVCADVPLAVERVILKAMAKSPDDRFSSAGALATALAAAVEGVEMPAELGPTPETIHIAARPARTPRKKLPVWVLVGGGVLAVAIVAAAVFILPNLGNEPVRPATPSPGAEMPAGPPAPPDERPSEAAIAHFDAGRNALDNWELDTAIAELTRAIDLAPGFAEAYVLRGVARANQEQYALAEQDYNKAINLQPDLAEAYLHRGRLYLYELDRGEEALADYDRLIELAPELPEAYVERAQCYLWYMDDEERALADLDRAARLAPENAQAIALRGEIYYGREEYERALRDLTQAAELAPDDAWIWDTLGLVYHALGRYEEAVGCYDRALRLEPNELEFLHRRGVIHLLAGDLRAATDDLERVLAVDPEHSSAQFARGRVHVALQEYEMAIERFSLVIDIDLDEMFRWPFFEKDHPRLDRALAVYEVGRVEEALADLNWLIEQHPYEHILYYHRGIIHKETGDTDAAIQDFLVLRDKAPDETWRRRAEEELRALQGG